MVIEREVKIVQLETEPKRVVDAETETKGIDTGATKVDAYCLRERRPAHLICINRGRNVSANEKKNISKAVKRSPATTTTTTTTRRRRRRTKKKKQQF